MKKLVISNIGFLTTPEGFGPLAGEEQKKIRIVENAYLVCEEERILFVGSGEVPSEFLEGADVIDAEGKLVTPGLVDAHTHLVFGGWREHELAMKRRGVPYLEILAAGGGILATQTKTREATEEALVKKAGAALSEMLRCGVTTCEGKSGYGLDLENELKQLRVMRTLNEIQPVELVSTYMGAHAVPGEYKENREGYLKLMCETVIPAVAEEGLAEFCDVFCETGVFDTEEAVRVLKAGLEYGLRPKMHADEINAIGGTEAAGKLGAISVEHLIAATDEGIDALAKGGCVAVCLPATSFYLSKPYARAKDMIAAGVPVAAASDFNPGSCPSFNLQFVMNLACWNYGLSPEEVLTAVTLNAAAAINRADQVGSIEPGKQADILIWDAPNLDYVFYRFGQNLVKTVIKKGKVV